MANAKATNRRKSGISCKPHITCRASVKWFAEQMEAKLAENDHKGGWENCSLDYLLGRLRQEVNELELELLKPIRVTEAVVSESTDISNFALMIADLHAHRHGR